MSVPDSASAQTARLRDHFAHVILPIWQGSGFDHTLRLPFEAVDPATHAPLPATRYRAMACARQLFVFALERGFLDTILDRVVVEPFRRLTDGLTRFDRWLCLPRLSRAAAEAGDAMLPTRRRVVDEGHHDE